jgi:hypothetical protein
MWLLDLDSGAGVCGVLPASGKPEYQPRLGLGISFCEAEGKGWVAKTSQLLKSACSLVESWLSEIRYVLSNLHKLPINRL